MARYAALAYTNVTDTLPLYVFGTTYSINSVVRSTTGGQYISLIDNNVGNPLSDITKWLYSGFTNKWKMFNLKSSQDQTVMDTVIQVQLLIVGNPCDSLALFNIDCSSVQVRMRTTADGLVFDQTYTPQNIDPTSDSVGNQTAEQQLIFPSPRSTDLVITNLPSHANAIIEVKINAIAHDTVVGSFAKCGLMLVGYSQDLGGTQYGAKVGITDYSTKTTDTFGNQTVVERPFRKTAEFQVMVSNAQLDYTQMVLAQYRAIPIVYIGSDAYSSTAVYGFYRDFDTTISYPEESLLSINIEGIA